MNLIDHLGCTYLDQLGCDLGVSVVRWHVQVHFMHHTERISFRHSFPAPAAEQRTSARSQCKVADLPNGWLIGHGRTSHSYSVELELLVYWWGRPCGSRYVQLQIVFLVFGNRLKHVEQATAVQQRVGTNRV